MTKRILCPTQLLHPQAAAPTRANPKAAGYDICCVGGVEGIDPTKWDEVQRAEWAAMGERGYVDLRPGDCFLFRTGFAQAIQEDHCCLLWDRSGMGGKKKIHRMAGVIDEDYRGEWLVSLVNHSSVTHRIFVGDKIVQGVYTERIEAECPVVPALASSERGAGGFGSTDSPRPDTVPVAVPTEPEPQFDPGDNREGDLVGPEEEPVITDAEASRARYEITAAELASDPPGAVGVVGPTGPVAEQDSYPVEPPTVTAPVVPEAAPPAPNGYKYGPVMVYDGRDVGQALACLRDRQPGTAISWMARDIEFFPDGAPRIVPETLRSVPGRQAIAFNPLIPE